MKILVYTTLFPNNVWPNRCVFVKERMAPIFNRTDCEVCVVAPVPYYPPIKNSKRYPYSQVNRTEEIEGFQVFHPRYYMTPGIGMSAYGLAMFLSTLNAVRKVRESFDFDLIDSHFVFPDGFAAVLMGRYFGKPVVVTSHGTDINLYPTFPVIRRLLQYTLHRTSHVIAVSQALKNVITGMGIPDGKVTVIPNGIDTAKFHSYPRERARKELGLPLDKRIILSVGGLIPLKGFDLLIRGFKYLTETHGQRNIRLLIVGEGPSRGELERLAGDLEIREDVQFAGTVPHKDIHRYYNAADLFALASSREGWACVLTESLACGTPVVATRVWGAPELISSERYGMLTERSAQDIASKMNDALEINWDREEIARYGQGFTWGRAAGNVLDVFESVL